METESVITLTVWYKRLHPPTVSKLRNITTTGQGCIIWLPLRTMHPGYLWDTGWRAGVQLPAGAGILFLRNRVQIGSRAHKPPIQWIRGGSSQG